MPWTFAHPAAVLPLKRLCPKLLNFPALVVGSTTPDFGYYLGQFNLAGFAHTVSGSLLVCLPVGLALLGALYLLRKPLCFFLPQPHRGALATLAVAPPTLSLAGVVTTSVSVVLGAWTHAAWDSFTHKGGWMVSRIAPLQESVFRFGSTGLPGYHLLQQLSTLAGVSILAGAYWLWLRKCPRLTGSPFTHLEHDDRTRYILFAAIVAAAFAVAVPEALNAAASFNGYLGLRVFVFQAAVYATAAFIPLLVLCAVIYYALQRQAAG